MINSVNGRLQQLKKRMEEVWGIWLLSAKLRGTTIKGKRRIRVGNKEGTKKETTDG